MKSGKGNSGCLLKPMFWAGLTGVFGESSVKLAPGLAVAPSLGYHRRPCPQTLQHLPLTNFCIFQLNVIIFTAVKSTSVREILKEKYCHPDNATAPF